MSTRRARTEGFTLVEVLVALAIIAFGMTALFTTVNQAARSSGYLREKTLGQWIALNRITDVRLTGQLPADETTQGVIEYANQKWRWELKKIPTPVEGIVRLEARAALENTAKDSWVARVTGFMSVATTKGPPAIAKPQPNNDPWLNIGANASGGPPNNSPPPSGN